MGFTVKWKWWNVKTHQLIIVRTQPKNMLIRFCNPVYNKHHITLHCSIHWRILPVHQAANSTWLKMPNSMYFTDKRWQILNNNIYNTIIGFSVKLMPTWCRNWVLLPNEKSVTQPHTAKASKQLCILRSYI